MTDETKGRRIAVRVQGYDTEAEEQHDDSVLDHIVKLVGDLNDKAVTSGISSAEYGEVEALILDAHRHMKMPERDVVSGEPMEMIKQYIK